jgi:hypothetical protein
VTHSALLFRLLGLRWRRDDEGGAHRVDDQAFYQLLDKTGSPTTFICSTKSCGSGRTTTITIARTERLVAKPRTSDFSQKRGLKSYRSPENLHEKFGRGDWIRTSDPLRPRQVRYQAALRPDKLHIIPWQRSERRASERFDVSASRRKSKHPRRFRRRALRSSGSSPGSRSRARTSRRSRCRTS